MAGKPVYTVNARTIINMESGFKHKLLCDGPTFSAGSACTFSCCYCFVVDSMRKLRSTPAYSSVEGDHEDIVVRRANAVDIVRTQLTNTKGEPKYLSQHDTRVIYGSPLVDVAGNLELARETVAICKEILALTNWEIRLLSKSHLLPFIAVELEEYRHRMIYGVSTGTLDDDLASAFEKGTAKVSKRLESLHKLQESGFRTFGMICPILPQRDPAKYAEDILEAINDVNCEHIWAEALNVRGESMTRTCDALRNAGYEWEAAELARITPDKQTSAQEQAMAKEAWEQYSRNLFMGLQSAITRKGAVRKLRWMQYCNNNSRPWWERKAGVVVL